MPDLMPDTSVYKQGGLAGMSPAGILGLVQQSRDMQTRQGLSDALKATNGDPNASLNLLLRPDSPVQATPEMVQHLSELGKFYNEQAGRAIGSLYGQAVAGKATEQTIHQTATMLSGYHVPPDFITRFTNQAIRPDGSVDPDAVLQAWNTVSPDHPPPTTEAQTPGGTRGQIPTTAALFGGRGFIPTNIPGAEAAGGAAPATSAAQYSLAQKDAENFKAEIEPLKRMHQLGLEVGEEGLGKGTAVVNDLKNFLISSGAANKLADFDKDKVYNYQELTKFTKRLADQVSAGGTDARMLQAVGGNPNVGMNQQPFLAVVRYIAGMRRMKQAQYNEFSNDPRNIDPNTGNVNAALFGKWSSKFLQDQDPRAYAFDLMGKENATALYKELNAKGKEAEKARFNASLDIATKNGMGTGGF